MTKHEITARMFLAMCQRGEIDPLGDPVEIAKRVAQYLDAYENTMTVLHLPHYEAGSRYLSPGR